MQDPQNEHYMLYHKQKVLSVDNPDIVPSVAYSSELIRDIGRASLVAILDLVGKNSQSRINTDSQSQTVINDVMNFAARLQPADPKPKKKSKKITSSKKKKSKKKPDSKQPKEDTIIKLNGTP